MKASIDIENAMTGEVNTIELNINEYIEDKIIKFDISKLSIQEIELLKYAISNKKENDYIDIEMFFIDNSNIPEFGPDYDFYIKDDELVGVYNREIYVRKGV